MIDYAAMRARLGLKRDLRCSCGSKSFAVSPLMVTNSDGRTLSSNLGQGPSCSIYILLCGCGIQYYLSSDPGEQECTLVPVNSPEGKAFLEPSLPDFDVPGPSVEPPKQEEVHVEK